MLFESRGWKIVQEMAEKRIALAQAEALANNDETKFLDMYRRAHAAKNALVEFVSDLSDLSEGE